VRLIKNGSGYFDIRDVNDRWVRVCVTAGDLIELPAGIYHRGTVDRGAHLHCIRLFKDIAAWEALNRPCDDNSCRVEYVAAHPRDGPPPPVA
jgi:1,2-dihydroxy-3-keto-5-methylthiopentene dioxygenase